jgi:hypothetical protein
MNTQILLYNLCSYNMQQLKMCKNELGKNKNVKKQQYMFRVVIFQNMNYIWCKIL